MPGIFWKLHCIMVKRTQFTTVQAKVVADFTFDFGAWSTLIRERPGGRNAGLCASATRPARPGTTPADTTEN